MTTFLLAVKFSWLVSAAVFVSAHAQNYLGLSSYPLPVPSGEIKKNHPFWVAFSREIYTKCSLSVFWSNGFMMLSFSHKNWAWSCEPPIFACPQVLPVGCFESHFLSLHFSVPLIFCAFLSTHLKYLEQCPAWHGFLLGKDLGGKLDLAGLGYITVNRSKLTE